MKTLAKGLFCVQKDSTRHSNGPQSGGVKEKCGGGEMNEKEAKVAYDKGKAEFY